MKNTVSIILVFALLLSFAACRKIDKGSVTIETKPYIVDGEGVTRDIFNSDSGYFYFDEDGNMIEVDSNDVVVATNKVVMTESTTLTPEAQSFIDSFGDVDSIEDMMQADAVVPDLDNDEIIPEDSFDDIEVDVDNEGNPVHDDVALSYTDIISNDTFTMESNIQVITNGEKNVLPMNIMRNGNDLYFETALPLKEGYGSTKVNMLFLKDTCYIIIPSMRAYLSIPKETAGEMIPSDAFDIEGIEGDYVGSGTVEYGGKTYVCDVYETDGATTKYYYVDGQLSRVETVNGEDSSIIEFKKLTTEVDKSKFAVPRNYIDMSTVLGSDYLSTITG